ncbi:MAG TPA: amidase [Burkholderiales bacterium]|nr:amidase [Burkholderiales bacterium]
MSEPATLSLAEARVRRERRELSATELLQSCRQRIERWQPRLNAFVSTEVRFAGTDRGALAGIPLAHKDMFYRAGRVSNCGSKIRKGWVAPLTAAVLERLDAAGAADIGTLNMAEFAYGPTGHNEHWGDCCNPWKPECITGGSSSGSGAAVAARLVFGALGSDTGGSVRVPAAACGVTGLKTTWGRVSRHGAMPLSHSLDTIGPLARSAEDCALIFQAIAGHDVRDPLTSRAPVEVDLGRRALKVAVSSGWIERNAHPEVAAAVLAAARFFNAREVVPPEFELLSAHCLTVMQAEASAQHAQWMRSCSQDYSSAVRVRLEAGYAIPAAQYLEVLRLRTMWLERFTATTLAQADLYLCPAVPVPIPTREETGPRGGPEMPKRLAEVTRLTRWVNYLGVPALVVPCGFDRRGLPIGLQLVARPFAEGALLAAGHRFQQETDWHRRAPPEFGDAA